MTRPPVLAGTIQRSVGRNIRAWRKFNGLTQEQLAERLGCSVRYLGDVERGVRNLSVQTIEQMAGALGEDPLELIAGGQRWDQPSED